MRELFVILGAAGIGAGLMYMLDPDRGARRRALVRDKMTKFNRQTQRAVTGRFKDLRNRAKGMLHEATSGFEREGEASDQQATFS